MLLINMSASGARCIYTGRFATKTTMTAQYAAVAENISKFRDCVVQSAAEKIAVKMAIAQSLEPIL